MGITSKNTFRLKPNLFVITKSKATMGGAFSDTKLVWKTEDAGLKQADLEFVSKYFLAIALEQLQASRGALLTTQASTNCGPYRPLPKQCNPWQKDPRKKDFAERTWKKQSQRCQGHNQCRSQCQGQCQCHNQCQCRSPIVVMEDKCLTAKNQVTEDKCLTAKNQVMEDKCLTA